MLIRLQLMVPNNNLLSAESYNQMFTMHGTTMIFLGVMPLSAAFFNYMVPLMIGARDVAFPRLNAFSYWTFFAGRPADQPRWLPFFAPEGYHGIGQAPGVGWFGYATADLQGLQPRPRPRLLDRRPAVARRRLGRRRAELHRHDHQPARARA